jgi:arylsulfatase A-like enzyme
MKKFNSILAFVMVAVCGSRAGAAETARPNILLIVADDLGYGELGCQGDPQVPTPHIDSISRNGIRFTSGYVSCPVCSPTRAGLMTGRYQQRFGHEFNPGNAAEAGELGLSLKEKTIAQRLKHAGYATGAFGKWHLGYKPQFHPLERGFDEFYGFLGGAHDYRQAHRTSKRDKGNPILRGRTPVKDISYTTTEFGNEAAAFIDRHHDQPWFVYLSFNAVHAPLQAPGKHSHRFKGIKNDKRQTFARMLAAMDDAVGVVLTQLRHHHLEENTLIFFVSDNGGPTGSTTSRNDPLNGAKGQVFEGGIRVPFLMQWKGHLPEGKTDDRPVISLDILSTALAAAGQPVPKTDEIDGVSLLPYFNSEKNESPHEALFWRYGQKRAVRIGQWKLTDQGDGAKLYDLNQDIGEKHDLSGQQPDTLQQLEAAYAKWNARNIPAKWGNRGSPVPSNQQPSDESEENTP